jgi:hypothetical protein
MSGESLSLKYEIFVGVFLLSIRRKPKFKGTVDGHEKLGGGGWWGSGRRQ